MKNQVVLFSEFKFQKEKRRWRRTWTAYKTAGENSRKITGKLDESGMDNGR